MCENSHQSIDLEAFRAAKEARNFEISLFWQRSNYFLVLSTAIAAGFFSLREAKYALPLAVFGLFVGLLWVAVNLGSKFWHSRWEYRLRIAEEKLSADMKLFSASWESMEDDVRQSFTVRKRGPARRIYERLVLRFPSVNFMMTLLSVLFVLFWVSLIIVTTTK